MNTNFENENVNGSLPTAAESTEPPTNLSAKLYKVWVSADVKVTFGGNVSVYATDGDKAVRKVKAQIDAESLDDLEMEAMLDEGEICTMLYAAVKENLHLLRQTFTVELSEDELDPDQAIEVEIEELQASISWNSDALAKHKAFLESLLNEGDDKQAVRRSSVVKDDVDPADVLEAEVEELQASISWNIDSLAKHKAFLELLSNDSDERKIVQDGPTWLHCVHYPDDAPQFTKRAVYFVGPEKGEYTIPCVVCPECLLTALTPYTVCAGVGPDPMPNIPTFG